MKNIFALIFICLSLGMYGCKSTTEPTQPNTPQEKIIYSNSFESSADTAGWKGGCYRFENQPAPSCGKQSLWISGTDVVPHALYILPSSNEDRHLYFRLWGKTYPKEGQSTLIMTDHIPFVETSIFIKDTVWTHYQSDTLLVPRDVQPKLELNSGGFSEVGGMLVDGIEIVQVK